MTKSYLIHIYPGGSDTCSEQMPIDAVTHPDLFCKKCKRRKKDLRCLDFRIAEKKPMHLPISAAAFSRKYFSLKTFFEELIIESPPNDWVTGRLFNSEGDELADWLTFINRQQVIVRGDKNVSYLKCDECKTVSYFATGRRHVISHQVDNRKVMQSDLGGLLIEPTLYERICPKNLRAITKRKVIIVDEPFDGLGEL